MGKRNVTNLLVLGQTLKNPWLFPEPASAIIFPMSQVNATNNLPPVAQTRAAGAGAAGAGAATTPATTAAPATPTMSAEAQGLLSVLSSDPKKLQAFAELVAAAVMASGALQSGWQSMSQQSPEAQKQMQEQLDWQRQNLANATSQANYWKDMASAQLGMSSGIGVQMGPNGMPNFNSGGFGMWGNFGADFGA